jgi:hypothetical protein
MMSRKDYNSTAEILFGIKYAVSPEIHLHLVDSFIEIFSTDNPRFDAERFRNACK